MFFGTWIILSNIAAASVVLLFFAYAPVFIDVNPKAYRVILPEKFEKGLTYNERLSATERLFEGKIIGPESLALYNGNIYTGLRTGEIVKIKGDKIETVAHIGEEGNGRTLGLRFDKKGLLYAADAYYGLHSVDIKTGKATMLLPFGTELNGRKITFLDDLDVDGNGVVYISDASTRWTLEYVAYIGLEHDDSGRVIAYDTKTGKASVLVDNLHFPNGVQLTHDGSGLLIAELLKLRILKYHLKGPKKGEVEVFATLPGEPDNIRLSKRGGYWVAFVGARNMTSRTVMDYGSEYPLIRKIVTRLMHSVGTILGYVTTLWPSPLLKHYADKIKCGEIAYPLMLKSCLVAELNSQGEIVQSLHSSDHTSCYVSEVLEDNGHLYMGSFVDPFLRKVKL